MGAILERAMRETMTWLASKKDTIFVGQSVSRPGTSMYASVKDISADKKIEFPVAEDFQIGFCIGLSLQGFVPVSIFPRWNFLIVAANQIVNHLDRIPIYSGYKPKVIIRTAVGKKSPLDPGPQHCDDFTDAFKGMLKAVRVVKIGDPKEVFSAYREAYESEESTIIVE